ncbi:MAG: hypothetical protein A2328_11775 [Bdellovibrionales bacterium RIFOXYB2_FULL_36_6]|nr:MAG: hypothetical protein A2328_11775 [Bdellovibrionales bacterium RIFOXYB2_FULL_36_6]OGS23175.1 MAG: hypothetical protein A2252_02885 [Elusimicrobia bacterium RIFOXYA2_FULL_39_19]
MNIILIIVSVLLELTAAAYLFLNPSPNIILLLLSHTLACIVFSVYSEIAFRQRNVFLINSRNVFFIVYLLPVYGMAGILLIYLFFGAKQPKSELFHLDIEEGDDEPLPKTSLAGIYNKPSESTGSSEESEIFETESIMDILTAQDKEKRLGAITALSKIKDTDAISIIASSLNNAMSEVRYYAVEALSKISQEYMNKIQSIKKKLEKLPGSLEIKNELADCYFEYGIKGIEEEMIQNYYLSLAGAIYEELLKNEKENMVIMLKLMEINFQLKKYTECINYGKEILKIGPGNTSAVARLAECYFALGDLAHLKEISGKIMAMQNAPAQLKDSAGLWV